MRTLLWAVVWLVVLGMAGRILGQGPTQPLPVVQDPPPGMVLVDDMYLPWGVVYGDSLYTGSPWPGGVVPYAFDAGVSSFNQQRMLRAFAEVEAISQVRFVPYTSGIQVMLVRVNPNQNNVSFSPVGAQSFPQSLTIGSNHFGSKYTLVHELFHALGFRHEQSRPDRNTYVGINYSNISQTGCDGSSCTHNFNIASTGLQFGPYDFLSIMHYGQSAFAANGTGRTIIATPAYSEFQNQMGNRAFMTDLDAQGVAAVYGAPSSPTITSLSQTSALVGSAGFTLTVNGTQFFEGSATSDGVQGSVVKFNGFTLDTTYVDKNTLTAWVPANRLQSSGNVSIRVDNDLYAGFQSASVSFSINLPPCSLTNDRRGHGLAAVGDVNGDGFDDYVVGEPGYLANDGRVICYSGRTGAAIWNLPGNSSMQYGFAVANAGDVNGDGVNDVLASAPAFTNWQGFVNVLNGVNGATIRTMFGSAQGAEFGYSVANAGDVNLDGIPDHIIGAPSGIGSGYAQIRSGSTGSVFWSLSNNESGSRFGYSVGGGHDMTGDGRPEVIVGAPWADGTAGQDTGKVYIYAGAFATLYTTKQGDGNYDYLGRSVAIIPSTSGGSRAKALAGASDFGSIFGAGGGAGYVKVYNGTSLLFNWTTSQTYNGYATGDRYGESVAAAGDIDDDGAMDILIGAVQDGTGAGSSTGPGFIEIRSGRTGAILHTQSGSVNGEKFGWVVSAAGDVDQDGIKDVLVGAPYADVPCPNAGAYTLIKPLVRPERRKVLLTEISTDGPLGQGIGVEITNFAANTISLSGWTLAWKSGGTIRTSQPIDVVIQSGESIVVTEPGVGFSETPGNTQVLTRFPVISTGGGDFALGLINAAGITVDEVHAASVSGIYDEGSLGGAFRGRLHNNQSSLITFSISAERIWGLDSNGGSDWTTNGSRSMGLENTSDGVRGYDPLPRHRVVINEMDDSPDYIELCNTSLATVDLKGWTILCSGGQRIAHAELRPFPNSRLLSGGGYLVIGDNSTRPSEMPANVPYVDLASIVGGGIPWTSNEYDCALYDVHGRLIDLVRTLGHDDTVVHNDPRAPSAPEDFGGAADRNPQSSFSSGAIGRNALSRDTDTGADFRPFPIRTMGSPNAGLSFWSTGEPELDVRLNSTDLGGGLGVIINAGPEHAGEKWSFLFSYGHLAGQGPIFGLGAEAYNNWLLFSNTPPWFGTLNNRGSARLDVPAGTFAPGVIQTDDIFLLQDAMGGLTIFTSILELDI